MEGCLLYVRWSEHLKHFQVRICKGYTGHCGSIHWILEQETQQQCDNWCSHALDYVQQEPAVLPSSMFKYYGAALDQVSTNFPNHGVFILLLCYQVEWLQNYVDLVAHEGDEGVRVVVFFLCIQNKFCRKQCKSLMHLAHNTTAMVTELGSSYVKIPIGIRVLMSFISIYVGRYKWS